MEGSKIIILNRERYQELIKKEILMSAYEKAISDLTKEVKELRAINSLDAKKKFYKHTFNLDMEDYKAARKSGMSNKEYAELHNISTRYLREKLGQEQIKTPPLTKEKYLELRKEGALNKDIAQIYDMTERTLYTILDKFEAAEEGKGETS